MDCGLSCCIQAAGRRPVHRISQLPDTSDLLYLTPGPWIGLNSSLLGARLDDGGESGSADTATRSAALSFFFRSDSVISVVLFHTLALVWQGW